MLSLSLSSFCIDLHFDRDQSTHGQLTTLTIDSDDFIPNENNNSPLQTSLDGNTNSRTVSNKADVSIEFEESSSGPITGFMLSFTCSLACGGTCFTLA